MKKILLLFVPAIFIVLLSGCIPYLVLLQAVDDAGPDQTSFSPEVQTTQSVADSPSVQSSTPAESTSAAPVLEAPASASPVPAVTAPQSVQPSPTPAPTLSPGDILDDGSQIVVSDVCFEYSDGEFTVTNNSERLVRVTGTIVGVKSDGSYEYVMSMSLAWTDEALYKKELEENGWAIKKTTNLLRPGESGVSAPFPQGLYLVLTTPDAEDIDPDVDGDGFYDVVFTVSPQKNEDSLVFSTSESS